uniref:Uncharacterized protein n=1 Tax=Panagrolaimus superbus TaxID=310955 RepID=A0A914ZEM9_9BILA
MILVLFLIHLLIQDVIPAKAPICTGIKFNSNWLTCDTNKSFYNYTLDLNVSIDYTNATFPNKVIFSNFTAWSVDPSFFHPVPPVTFWFWSDVVPQEVMQWDLSTPSYTFNYPNGVGDFNFYLSVSDTNFDFEYPSIFIDSGEVFHYSNYGLFNPHYPCSSSDVEDFCDDGGPKNNQSICCNDFVFTDIPDKSPEICETYESETMISSQSGEMIANLNATFHVIMEALNISVIGFKSSRGGNYKFMAMIGDTSCNGNSDDVFSNCSFSFPTNDFRFDMSFIFDHYSTIATKLIRRNKIFFKDGNVPFTPADPCWKNTSPIPFGKGTVSKTKFCCTKFKGTVTATVTNPTTSSPENKCLKYSSNTNVTDNSASLIVNYKFNNTGLIIEIVDYKDSAASTVQLEAYSKDLFSQTCSASTKNPQNTCIFKMSDSHKYELQMRTSILPDGFNMLAVIEQNKQFVTPFLTSSMHCYHETNPYNYVNSKLNATTQFCCETFA